MERGSGAGAGRCTVTTPSAHRNIVAYVSEEMVLARVLCVRV